MRYPSKGDRVRITQEGTVIGHAQGHLTVRFDGALNESTINPSAMDCAKVERLSKPLCVGDKVVPTSPSHCYGELRGINGDMAWVYWEHNKAYATLRLDCIRERSE